MARPLRIEYPGAVYHITNRGNDKKAVFKDDQARETFFKILAHVGPDRIDPGQRAVSLRSLSRLPELPSCWRVGAAPVSLLGRLQQLDYSLKPDFAFSYAFSSSSAASFISAVNFFHSFSDVFRISSSLREAAFCFFSASAN